MLVVLAGKLERDRVVVPTVPSLAGVPEVVVQYERLPAVSEEEVAMYEMRESVPVLVMVPPLRPVPAVMEMTAEEVAIHCAEPLAYPQT